MKNLKMLAALGLGILSVSAYANDESPLFVCSIQSPTNLEAPGYKLSLTVKPSADIASFDDVKVEYMNTAADKESALASMEIVSGKFVNAGIAGDSYYDGITKEGQNLTLSIVKNPKSGEIGLMAPTYTATLTISGEAEQKYLCTSPRDPQ